ncbi:MAG TPA: class I SAM-dependent methyltransferase [Dehalococcoidia bacterium]|nr:class I SAM-dependent methyltransferase [Dehalococcoidia bacterium]
MPRSRREPSILLHLFDRRASRYDAWFEKPPGALQFPGEVAALRLVLAEVPGPWLEVGTGTGRFGSALDAAVGLDPSRAMLKRAKRRRLPVVQGTGDQLPFQDQTFGGVLIVLTLCFVPDPRPLLREAWRVLRTEGGIAVGAILRDSPWGKNYQEQGQRGHPLYRYAHFYSARELESLLCDAGFRITERACSVVQPPSRVTEEERGWWGYSQYASFIALLARKVG